RLLSQQIGVASLSRKGQRISVVDVWPKGACAKRPGPVSGEHGGSGFFGPGYPDVVVGRAKASGPVRFPAGGTGAAASAGAVRESDWACMGQSAGIARQ